MQFFTIAVVSGAAVASGGRYHTGVQMQWFTGAESAEAAGHGPWVVEVSSQPCCKKRKGRSEV